MPAASQAELERQVWRESAREVRALRGRGFEFTVKSFLSARAPNQLRIVARAPTEASLRGQTFCMVVFKRFETYSSALCSVVV